MAMRDVASGVLVSSPGWRMAVDSLPAAHFPQPVHAGIRFSGISFRRIEAWAEGFDLVRIHCRDARLVFPDPVLAAWGRPRVKDRGLRVGHLVCTALAGWHSQEANGRDYTDLVLLNRHTARKRCPRFPCRPSRICGPSSTFFRPQQGIPRFRA